MADLNGFFASTGAAPHDCAYSDYWADVSGAAHLPLTTTKGSSAVGARHPYHSSGNALDLGGQWVSPAQPARSWTPADTFDFAMIFRDTNYPTTTFITHLSIRIFSADGATEIGVLYEGEVNASAWSAGYQSRHCDAVSMQNSVDMPENGHLVVEVGGYATYAATYDADMVVGENMASPMPLNDTTTETDSYYPWISFTYGAGGDAGVYVGNIPIGLAPSAPIAPLEKAYAGSVGASLAPDAPTADVVRAFTYTGRRAAALSPAAAAAFEKEYAGSVPHIWTPDFANLDLSFTYEGSVEAKLTPAAAFGPERSYAGSIGVSLTPAAVAGPEMAYGGQVGVSLLPGAGPAAIEKSYEGSIIFQLRPISLYEGSGITIREYVGNIPASLAPAVGQAIVEAVYEGSVVAALVPAAGYTHGWAIDWEHLWPPRRSPWRSGNKAKYGGTKRFR